MPRSRLSLRLIDSITELTGEDAGCIAVSGSHGGASSARYAIAAAPKLSVFNDAGVGRAKAGIAGLAMLQEAGLAACAVSHESACIGLAASTWQYGVISHCNALAAEFGLEAGKPLAAQVRLRLGQPEGD